MGAKTWQHVVVQAPLRWAPELLPADVQTGTTTFEIRHEASIEGAFWGKDSRRYRAVWSTGRRTGKGYIEIRPHSTSTFELVVHMSAPSGIAGLAWSERRLARAALGVGLTIRQDVVREAARMRVPARRKAVQPA